jgi:hypothetical protein
MARQAGAQTWHEGWASEVSAKGALLLRRVADAASLDDDEGAEPDAVTEQPWAAVEARR